MGMIDRQYKDTVLRQCIAERKDLWNQLQEWKQLYRTLWKKYRMTENLLELNMKDFHDVIDQRDWYYDRYRQLKDH